MEFRGRRSFFVPSLFLILIVIEKLTVLHLPANWLVGEVHVFGGAPAAFGLALLFFGARPIVSLPLRPIWDRGIAWTHGLILLILFALQVWYGRVQASLPLQGSAFRVMAVTWTALIPAAVVTLLLIFVSPSSLRLLLKRLALPATAAALVTAAFLLARHIGDQAWANSSAFIRFVQHACFWQTRAFLGLFYQTVISNPDHQILGTQRYIIQVSWLCSGLEGLLLVAVLIALWIFFFRRELIVSRALLVFPIALLLTWCANIARLAALIAIGDHGHAFLADLGFHTQAGWVSLNLIVLGSLAAVQNAAWFRKYPDGPQTHATQPSGVNHVAVYLLPFTVIIAASLFTQGLAEGFERFYPLRLLVALVAFWFYRSQYRAIDWRFGPAGLLAGVLVGALWIVARLHMHVASPDAVLTANALGATTRLYRWSWITLRVLAATVTVPIAEELAFRGFVARRVQRIDFETLPYRNMNVLSIAVSSVAFGALHGHMWIAGILSGAVFWGLARYKNRLGEAVAAHAVANAVIAIAAVIRHDYSLW